MSTKKRPYVPKTKGCYPCSRRRIHCDRTEPTCHKCAARGLQCTGLGLKLRFPYGAPVSVSTISEAPGTSHLSRPNAFRANDPAFASRSSYDQTFPPEVLHGFGSTEHLPPSVSLSNGDISHSTTSSSQQHVSKDLSSYSAFGASVELERHETSLARFNQIGGIPHIPAEITPLWKRIMCKYFSDNIAPEMTAIDGSHNEWRHLVLSLAQTDNLVMDAVVTVAFYHLELNKSTQAHKRTKCELSATRSDLRDPNEMYNRVIQGLRSQPGLNSGNVNIKISVSITILILFVGAMVTGGSDFLLLSRMLESAIEAMGGEDKLPRVYASDFIKNQNHKIRIYAAPLLNERRGLQFISSQTHKEQLFNSLTHRLLDYPEHSPTMMLVRDLVQQALDLYIAQFDYRTDDQASEELGNMTSIIRVQHFKETLEAFPQGAPGERVLVWACFIAASASILDEHKEFFEQILLRHQSRNGFINILEGLECLRRIWSRTSQERWTSLLAQVNVLVM
ncbi:unnamed protein product [Clonostachys rosea f. rosea IK726]|uniref:Zn(2)-C6 fungal-type domain-containing protein n=3 Tax=Bionectria ochroleuca TaxID=29856 RepID=A0A0B7KIQ6_BIOOC|nr:unnamed protein product [Clonostachys rosea f. rosea IK726]